MMSISVPRCSPSERPGPVSWSTAQHRPQLLVKLLSDFHSQAIRQSSGAPGPGQPRQGSHQAGRSATHVAVGSWQCGHRTGDF